MLGGELLSLEQKPSLHPCSSLLVLTDALENPLGLVLPPDPEEVNRDPTEDDCKANGAFLRRHPEGNSDEKQAGQDEENGQADVHLNTDPKSRLQAAPREHGTFPVNFVLPPQQDSSPEREGGPVAPHTPAWMALLSVPVL